MQTAPKNISIASKTFSWKDGINWFTQGIELFKQVKNIWYVNCLLLAILLGLVAGASATLAMLVMIFVSPMLTAFMMHCCAQARKNQGLSLASGWQAVFSELNYFMLLGLISSVLMLVMQQIYLQLMALSNLPVELTQEMAQQMSVREALLRVLFNLMTNLPVAMALAFSPALLLFKRAHPWQAIKSSVAAVLHSWKAFLLMVLLIVLVLFGALVLASVVTSMFMTVLGTASQFIINLLVLFFAFTITGIGLCCQYQAYTELFDQNSEESEDNGTEIYTEI